MRIPETPVRDFAGTFTGWYVEGSVRTNPLDKVQIPYRLSFLRTPVVVKGI